MSRQHAILVAALASTILAITAAAQAPPTTGSKLPVVEATIFKDGHAYLLREMAIDPSPHQDIVLDELPAPVLGTFWPFASGGAQLVSAKAGRQTVAEDIGVVDLRQLARANIGKEVVVVDLAKERIEGRLVAMPERGSDVLLVATALGTRAVPMAQVHDLEIKGELKTTLRTDRQKEQLTLTVDHAGAGAKVGVMYVQRGLRWIPSYRLDIDGAGKVSVQMQASIVNDLINLEHATVQLVVGVPKFEFEGLLDPISLQQEIAQVAANTRGASALGNMMSNSLMTQSAGALGGNDEAPASPTVEGGEASEDLFVYTVRDVTLAKGERMVLPIASFELTYRDVYKLEVPFAPPMEVRQGLQSERVLELARQLAAPKAMHVLRLQNKSQAPLTTAPALVLAKGRVLAQGRMLYTPIGAETDLAINAAIDIGVESEEHETGRTPNAQDFDGTKFGRVDLAGAVVLRNRKPKAVEIEVSRRVLGLVDSVGQDGMKQQLDLAELWHGDARPAWWSWWSWPYWWFRCNGFGELRWTVKLEPKAEIRLDASWHYFWR